MGHCLKNSLHAKIPLKNDSMQPMHWVSSHWNYLRQGLWLRSVLGERLLPSELSVVTSNKSWSPPPPIERCPMTTTRQRPSAPFTSLLRDVLLLQDSVAGDWSLRHCHWRSEMFFMQHSLSKTLLLAWYSHQFMLVHRESTTCIVGSSMTIFLGRGRRQSGPGTEAAREWDSQGLISLGKEIAGRLK